MLLPRMTTRRWMIVVAAVGLLIRTIRTAKAVLTECAEGPGHVPRCRRIAGPTR
jgi:hypothetical protein